MAVINNMTESLDARLRSVEQTLSAHSGILEDIRNMLSYLISKQRFDYNSHKDGFERNSIDSADRVDRELCIDDISAKFAQNKLILPLTKLSPKRLNLSKNSKASKDIAGSSGQYSNRSRSYKTERLEKGAEKKVADSSINQIFSPSQTKMVKKKLIIEPIDVCAEQTEAMASRTAHGNYTSRNAKKPALILNLANASRNVNVEKSSSALSAFMTERNNLKRTGCNAVKASKQNVPVQINSFKSSGRNSKVSEKPLQLVVKAKPSVKCQLPTNNKSALIDSILDKLERLPGNCLGLIAKFLGGELGLILCSKKVLINYSNYKLRKVKAKIMNHKNAKVFVNTIF